MTGAVAWAMLRADRLRSLLVLLLAGIPALLIGMTAVVVPSVRDSQLPVMKLQYGASGIATCSPQGDTTASQLVASMSEVALPTGSRYALVSMIGGELVHVGDHTTLAQVTEGDFTDPILSPRLRLLSGSLPRTTGEAALSPAAARALRGHLGDTVALLGTHVRVVGLVRDRTNWNGRSVFVGLGTTGDRGGFVAALAVPQGVSLRGLIDRGKLPCVYIYSSYNSHSVLMLTGRDTVARAGIVFSGLLLALILGSLTVATALKVTARRSLEDLRLLRENGATARRLRAVLLRQGIVLGTASGVVGVLFGLVAGRVSLHWIQDYNDWELSHVNADPRLLVVSFSTAVACATVGAAVASRSTVRAVLHDSRGPLSHRRHPLRPVGGTLLLLGGGVVTCRGVGAYAEDHGALSRILTGAVALVAGTALVSPLVTVLWARVAARGRSLDAIVSRQVAARTGRGPYALAAVACAVAAAVGATMHAAAVAGAHADRDAVSRHLPSDEVRLSYFEDTHEVTAADVAAITRGFRVLHTATVASAQLDFLDLQLPGGRLSSDDERSSIVACDRPGLFDLLGVTGDVAAARAAMARGEIVVNGGAHQSTTVYRLPDYDSGASAATPQQLPVTRFTGLSWHQTGQLPAAIVAACPKDLERNPHVVIQLDHVPTVPELSVLDTRAQLHNAVLDVGAARGHDDGSARALAVILVIIAGVFAALVTGVATALSTLDAHDDEVLLHEAGARRRTRRGMRALRAFTISAQGVVLGGAIGTGVGLGTCLTQGYRPAVFWESVLLVIATPFLLAAAAALLPLKRTPLT